MSNQQYCLGIDPGGNMGSCWLSLLDDTCYMQIDVLFPEPKSFSRTNLYHRLRKWCDNNNDLLQQTKYLAIEEHTISSKIPNVVTVKCLSFVIESVICSLYPDIVCIRLDPKHDVRATFGIKTPRGEKASYRNGKLRTIDAIVDRGYLSEELCTKLRKVFTVNKAKRFDPFDAFLLAMLCLQRAKHGQISTPDVPDFTTKRVKCEYST